MESPVPLGLVCAKIYIDVVHAIRPIISQLIDVSINLQRRGGTCPIAGDATLW